MEPWWKWSTARRPAPPAGAVLQLPVPAAGRAGSPAGRAGGGGGGQAASQAKKTARIGESRGRAAPPRADSTAPAGDGCPAPAHAAPPHGLPRTCTRVGGDAVRLFARTPSWCCRFGWWRFSRACPSVRGLWWSRALRSIFFPQVYNCLISVKKLPISVFCSTRYNTI
jgi:hypothetical protein